MSELGPLEAEWDAIEPLAGIGRISSFVSGEPHGSRIRVLYARRRADGALVGRAWFGPGAEGPPGHAHGGSMAAVLDEAMGASAWIAGHPVLAARLTVQFRRPLPLDRVVLIETSIEAVVGRKVETRGRLIDELDREPYCESEGLFVALDAGAIARMGSAGLARATR